MKVAGVEITKPKPKTIVIPLDDKQHIVFKCAPVLDFDEFDRLCPRPSPEIRNYGDNDPRGKVTMDKDPDYLARLIAWRVQQTNWMILESLKATPGLEWDSVKEDDPETWPLYEEDLKSAGFSQNYINAINGTAVEACGVSQAAIDEATQSFLASQVEE